jgi:hypothetical protein
VRRFLKLLSRHMREKCFLFNITYSKHPSVICEHTVTYSYGISYQVVNSIWNVFLVSGLVLEWYI